MDAVVARNGTRLSSFAISVVDARSSAARRDHSESQASLEQKSRALTEEMQRVAREDEQLLRDLVRLDELKQIQTKEQQERRSGR